MQRTIVFALMLAFVLSPLILTAATAQKYVHVRTLKGHTDRVTAVAFSSNGSQLASSSGDSTIRLWNGKTGAHIRTLRGHRTSVHSVTFRPGGSELASVGDHTVREWNTNTGHFHEYGEHQWAVAVAYHPHGHILASGSSGSAAPNTIKLWNYHSGERIVTLAGHTDSVTTVAWSPDGRTLASGSYDQTIRIWNPNNRRQISVLRGHTNSVHSIAFSPDGRTLASGSYDQTIRIWNPSNRRTVHVLRVPQEGTQVTSVAFHPKGRILASGHLHDSNLHLWNPNTGQHIARLTGHTWNVLSVAFSPNGTLASSGGNDNTIRLWQQSVEPPDPVVSIPDPSLAAAIRAKIGNTLTTRTMLNLTALDASNRVIRDLTGLEHAQNLRELDLSYTGISDVSPLSRLTHLSVLWLIGNTISDVSPLSRLTRMQTLDLSNNTISDVSPLSRLTRIQTLDLSDNNISDVSPLPRLTHMTELDLRGNPLNRAAIRTYIPTLQAKGVAVYFDSVNIVPIVHVGAAERPPLYWVDTAAGTLQRLVGGEIENIAAHIRNAISIALDSDAGKIYWTAQSTQISGKVQRANLDGTHVENVIALRSVPMGIAIDSANQKLYWTNAHGRIQHMDLGTRQIQNLVQSPNTLNAIALDVAGGKMYWTEHNGRIRSANLNGKNVKNIATGLGKPLGIAIANNKVYWTEKTGNNTGRIQRANLNGTNRQVLRFLQSVPIGLHIDTTNNTLYWTNASGRIQRSEIGVNAAIENVVTDLVAPAAIAVESTTVTTPIEEPAQPTQPTPTALQSDVNQDGKVDNTDIRLVSNALGQRGNAITNARTDVNGDGHVDVMDIVEVIANLGAVSYSKFDVNQDGKVDNTDIGMVSNALGQRGDAITNARTDVNGDGQVNAIDIAEVIANLDDAAPGAPALANTPLLMTLDAHTRQEQRKLLLAFGDTAFAAQRQLADPQRLFAAARPNETRVLRNYPNPFNPETWIPYQLADSTDVHITIYDAQGRVVQVLQVGHQPAGYYTSRSRAAYWDGRNSHGEPVASGVYFYTFKAEAFTATRKMCIRK